MFHEKHRNNNNNTKQRRKIMIKVNKGTIKHEELLWKWEHCNKGKNLNHAYRGKVSEEKNKTFNDICFRATQTDGYNHDLKVVASNTYFYSTMYSFTVDNQTFVVYDTHANTYIFEI